MRVALVAAFVVVLASPARGASVDVLVVGKAGAVVKQREGVRLQEREVRVGGRRCRVGARTPLAALLATKVRVGLRDHGRCSRRPRDAGGLYVRSIAGVSESGSRSGWVYKAGRRLGTNGAADPAGPFGAGGLRDAAPVRWFWCRLDRAGTCPPTLETAHVRTGAEVRVTVRAFDDLGRGSLVEGATVRLGDQTATTAADGTAVLSGSGPLVAEKPGMVRSFTVDA